MCLGCCASCVCGCCNCVTNCCGKECEGGKAQRIPYLIVLFLGSFLAIILRYWGKAIVVPLLVTNKEVCDTTRCAGQEAVYRISFVMSAFFLAHAISQISGALKFHRSFWGCKIVTLVFGIVIAFLIPNELFDSYAFVARFFAALFLVIQVVLLIEFAYQWNTSWMAEDREWKVPILIVSVLLFTAAIIMCVYSFDWFGGDGCDRNNAFIALTIIVCVFVSGLSITNWAEHGALLPSAVVTLYVFWVQYNALSSDPNPSCNALSDPTTVQVVISCIIAAVSIVYAAYSMASKSEKIFELEAEEDMAEPFVKDQAEDAEAGRSKDKRDEDAEEENMNEEDRKVTLKSNLRFHLVMLLASMYLAMLVTNWGADERSSGVQDVSTGKLTLFVKMASVWLTLLLYAWSLIAPQVLSGRDFD